MKDVPRTKERVAKQLPCLFVLCNVDLVLFKSAVHCVVHHLWQRQTSQFAFESNGRGIKSNAQIQLLLMWHKTENTATSTKWKQNFVLAQDLIVFLFPPPPIPDMWANYESCTALRFCTPAWSSSRELGLDMGEILLSSVSCLIKKIPPPMEIKTFQWSSLII